VIRIGAASLNTNNRKRDEHLRSADFFNAEHHPYATISVTRLDLHADGTLAGDVHLEAAGHTHLIRPHIQIVAADHKSSTLRAEATVDRTEFGMTWSPLGMAARQAHIVIRARFVRPD
jgi:polyisoprenoid-binding protein YceI